MRVKDKFLEKINFLILIFSLCLSHKLYAENIYEKVFNYNDSLKNSSMNFIQTTFQDLQEGEVFFGDERIKINYNNPQKLTIIFSEKKGVYINHELEELSQGVTTSIDYLKPKGCGIVISYHSGEDRMVKGLFKNVATGGCSCPSKLPCVCGAVIKGKLPHSGVTASKEEIKENRRAKSARLRDWERV